MRLTLLGTGYWNPSLRRASSGYMIGFQGNDCCSMSAAASLTGCCRRGSAPTEIDRLFLSHLHSDHMMDYARGSPSGTRARACSAPRRWRSMALPRFNVLRERLFGPEGALAFDIEARRSFPGSQEVWLDRGGSLPRPEPQVSLTEIEAGFSLEARAGV